jgi:hypothetical protein
MVSEEFGMGLFERRRSRRAGRGGRFVGMEPMEAREMMSVAAGVVAEVRGLAAVPLVAVDNHPPTISGIKSFKTAVAAVPFTISYADLLAHSNAKDADSDGIAFEIVSIPASSAVTVNGGDAAAGTVIHPGDTVVWTGSSQKGGTRTAFAVKAFDGTDVSARTVAVKVATILKGDVRIALDHTSLREDGGKTATFTITRKHGDLTLATTIAYTVTGTTSNDGSDYTPVLTGTVVIPANVKKVTFTVAPINDHVAEGDKGKETLVVSLINTPEADAYLVNPRHGKATLKILDPVA